MLTFASALVAPRPVRPATSASASASSSSSTFRFPWSSHSSAPAATATATATAEVTPAEDQSTSTSVVELEGTIPSCAPAVLLLPSEAALSMEEAMEKDIAHPLEEDTLRTTASPTSPDDSVSSSPAILDLVYGASCLSKKTILRQRFSPVVVSTSASVSTTTVRRRQHGRNHQSKSKYKKQLLSIQRTRTLLDSSSASSLSSSSSSSYVSSSSEEEEEEQQQEEHSITATATMVTTTTLLTNHHEDTKQQQQQQDHDDHNHDDDDSEEELTEEEIEVEMEQQQQQPMPTASDLMELDDGELAGGEDAHFIASTEQHSYFGVADGVGGWNTLGINPAIFAWDLMETAKSVAETAGNSSSSSKDATPWRVLDEAYELVKQKGDQVAGSSTACIVSLDKWTGTLHSVNLGDSGFVLFRLHPRVHLPPPPRSSPPPPRGSSLPSSPASPSVSSLARLSSASPFAQPLSSLDDTDTTHDDQPSSDTNNSNNSNDDDDSNNNNSWCSYVAIHESTEKQHYFNAPYQLAVLPSRVPPAQRRFFMADNPCDATTSSFTGLQPGDIVVMGTDGLFDNVFVNELAAVLEEEIGPLFRLPGAAQFFRSRPGSPKQAQQQAQSRDEWFLTVRERVQQAADSLVRKAAMLALSSRISPFGQEAIRHGWQEHTGGKVDDVTVVTAMVVPHADLL